MLAEQPEDWTEPGAHPVVPGVFRLPLPLPMQGLHAVNVYVVEDTEGITIIDAGLAYPGVEELLKDSLRRAGYELGDIAQAVVTHVHWDHWTQALVLRESVGARIRMGRQETFANERPIPGEPMYGRLLPLLRSHGAGDLADTVERWLMPEEVNLIPWGPPDEWVGTGDAIGLAGRTLDVFETPGHTVGHIVLRDAANGLLFAGDHVLPHITPSIGFEPDARVSPLRHYLESLQLVRGMSDTVLLPAHGPVTTSVHTRIDELVEHHRVRLDRALGLVRRGHRTGFAVASAMGWTRREKPFGELRTMDRMLAVLEMGAHLQLLADTGVLSLDESDGIRVYSTVQ